MIDQDVKVQTIKAIPAIAGTLFYSITLNEVIGWATLVYIILQAAYLIWKWHREYSR